LTGPRNTEPRRHEDARDEDSQHSALSTQYSHQPSAPGFRVLHLITSLDVGGAQRHLLSLARGLKRRGHTADVAFLKNPTLEAEFRAAGIAVFDLGARGTLSPLLLPRLASLLRRGRYQIVHTHLLKADAYGAVAGIMAGTPLRIASKHNDERVLRRPAVAAMHGLLSRLNHRVVALSDYVARYVAEVGRVDGGRITRIYYGLTPASAATAEEALRVRADLGIPSDAPLAVTVGRLTEQKGLIHLLRAMAALRRSVPEARLLIVGDAQDGREEYKLALLSARAELGLEETVIFAGVRGDVPAVMRAADVFVMASLWEGFGLVFLEAMAAARPVVATNVSAVPEVVEDGITGLLVPPRDPDALSEAMKALLLDRTMAYRMGQAGLIRLGKQFTEERMIEATEDLYARLWSRR
jgi:glycosyltransferase involved in cell wall biosynthesis